MNDEKLTQHEEPEVYVAKLGCPYKLGDPLMTVWLEGFKVGMRHGGNIANKAIEDVFAERNGDAA